MTLRTRFWAYIAVLHAVGLGICIWQREALGLWFFVAEGVLLLSVIIGLRLVRLALEPLEFVQAFSDVINNEEFNARYSQIGQPEMDQLILAYNHMLERLQAERLRVGEQRGFLERFLSVTRIGILILDFDHRITLASPSAIVFLPELNRRKGLVLGELKSDLGQVIAGLKQGETELYTDPGGRRLRCRSSEFYDRGFSRGYFTIEELTEEITQTEKDTYEKLIRMMSHEVGNTVAATNSLLQSCRNYSDQIQNPEDRADFDDALRVLISRNQSLNEFTQGFAELVRLPEPEMQPASVLDLLNAMHVMFRPLCGTEIKLDREVPDTLPLVRMDRSLMEQVMINVLKNAIESIYGQGRVCVTASLQGRHVIVSVSDTGPGLAPEIQNNLFKPFYTTKHSGQGLGLTLVKEVLNKHGFRFALNSSERGAVFTVMMPTV